MCDKAPIVLKLPLSSVVLLGCRIEFATPAMDAENELFGGTGLRLLGNDEGMSAHVQALQGGGDQKAVIG